ncbi:MAG: ATP-binding cassette domain-containing protein [Candidatus Nanopelagicaceae bacterium]|nr:ATP-binding cassette domain-containing protein [Candidatus Nanopelagicaceae bacterium]
MIEVESLTKVFGSTRAVEDVTFAAPTGAVTGFLGPNGAGKTSTLRILLGLSRADQGVALINGVTYSELDSPRRTVGAVLDSMGYHPGRSGFDHLRIVAKAAGIAGRRVSEVLELVELTSASTRPVGGYSQGMRQRLALATALLGDPPTLVLDEPSNGLDPAGMAWLRDLIREWAKQGRTVLFSSHVLSEVEMVADHVVVINQGTVVREGAMTDLLAASPTGRLEELFFELTSTRAQVQL